MKHLLEFDSELAGEPVLIQVDEPLPEGGTELAARGEVAGKAQETFEDALRRVKPALESTMRELLDLTHKPDEVQVEFGITLSGKVGAFITAGVEANFRVSLTWKGGTGVASPGASA